MKIKKDDLVVVVAGNHKSPDPRRVLEVREGGRRVVVEGVAVAKKHVKKGHPKSPQGGRLEVEMPIDASNVMYFDEAAGKPCRLGYRFTADGAKERFCKGTGNSAGVVSPPKARYAAK